MSDYNTYTPAEEAEFYRQRRAEQDKIKKENFEKLLVGAGAAGNQFLFGIPEAIAKVAAKDAYKQWVDAKTKHKGAASIGDIVGLGAGMLVNPLGGVAGRLAQGGGKAAKLIKLATSAPRNFHGAFGRAAARAAPEVALRGISDAVTTEDAAGATKRALIGLGFGTALGGIMGNKARKMMPDDPLKRLNQTALKDAGVSTKQLRQALGSNKLPGKMIRQAEDLIASGAKMLDDYKISNAEELKTFLTNRMDTWNTATDSLEKIPKKELIAELQKRGADEIVEAVNDAGDEGGKALKKVIDALGKTKPKSFIAKLSGIESAAFKSSDEVERARGKIANILRDKVYDVIADTSDNPLLKTMRKEYGAEKLLKFATGNDLAQISGAIPSGGSDTFAKFAASGALSSAFGGGAMAATTGEGLLNEEGGINVGYLARVGGGVALGTMLNRMPASKVDELIRGLAPQLRPMLSDPKTQEVFGRVLKNAGGATSSLFAGVSQLAQRPEDAEANRQEITEREKKYPQPEENPEYINRAVEALRKNFVAKGYERIMTFDEYLELAKQRTDGYKPEKMSRIFYQNPEDAENFKKTIKIARKLRDTSDFAAMFRPTGVLGRDSGKAAAIQQFAGIYASNNLRPGEVPDDKKIAQLQKAVQNIDRQKISLEDKIKMLYSTLGIDPGLLKEYGIL